MELKIDKLSFSYSQEKAILKNISFAVEQGEILGILGTNGTGKTTLLKCINNILIPLAGDICFGEDDIMKLKQNEIAKIIAYVPQYANNLSPVTVIDFVMQGRIPYAGFSFSQHDKQIVLDVLQQFDLENYAFRKVNELSGGERQRVLIARAMAQNPQIIILDEPTSSLDLYNQLFILEIIKEMGKKQNLAVLMTIHDLNLASMFCDKLLMLKGGSVFAYGKAEDVLTEDNIKAVYNVQTAISIADGCKHIRLFVKKFKYECTAYMAFIKFTIGYSKKCELRGSLVVYVFVFTGNNI